MLNMFSRNFYPGQPVQNVWLINLKKICFRIVSKRLYSKKYVVIPSINPKEINQKIIHYAPKYHRLAI